MEADFELLTVTLMNNLEILDRRLSDTAMKVEDVALCIFVPHWRLVAELYQLIHILVLPPF